MIAPPLHDTSPDASLIEADIKSWDSDDSWVIDGGSSVDIPREMVFMFLSNDIVD